MAEIKVTESQFKLPDGVSVYQRTWEPPSAPVAKLIHIHGYSDHMNRYNDLYALLAARGIYCTGIDQRGWGKSVTTPAQRGNTGPTTRILSDMASFISSHLPSSVPVFVLGHSMGGGIILTMASTPEYKELIGQLEGILLESPYIALPPAQTPSAVKLFLGKLVGKALPNHQIVHKNEAKTLVRDPVIQKSLEEDQLCHNTGTLEMFAAMLDRSSNLSSGKWVLDDGVKAIWLAHGSADQCTSYDASKVWFESKEGGQRVGDREFKSYEGWSHQLHCDLPERAPVFAQDAGDWILKRVQKAEGSVQANL